MNRNFFDLKKVGVLVAMLGTTPVMAQSLPVVIPPVTDPLFSGLSIPASAPTQGMWGSSRSWPLVALHLSVLPDGQLLSYGTPIGQGVQDGRTFDRWDPLSTGGGHTTIANSANIDSFCSAGVLQTGGAMLVSGGDSNATATNFSRNSTVFNYTVNTATTQTSALANDRWYGSMIRLADGRSLMTGGGDPYVIDAYQNPGAYLGGQVSMTPEVWTPGSGWSSLTGANSRDAFGPDFNRWWYPRNWVAPNGQVFGISVEKMWYLNTSGSGSITTVGNFKTGYDTNTRPNVGPTSTAVMYNVGRILQVGGNGAKNQHATNSSEFATTFNINNGNPVVADTAPMQNRRQWANSTVVPNGRVVVTGGTRFADNGGADAVLAAEWWNPSTGTWSTLASAAIVRNYHSATVLMQNGTILSTGGGVPGGTGAPGANFNAEVFYPPYLFRNNGGQAQLADRPRMISIAARRFAYGTNFQIEMADTRTISSVAIIGLGATTHSFDMGQRFIPASFSQNGAMLTITAPASGNIAPPGYYQVVAVDSTGAPSRGFIISLGAALPAPNLIAHYPFDQTSGTNAPDASGNGKNGTLIGGATWVAGRVGSNAVRLTGSNQYVDLPDALVQGCTDFTWAGWVNLASNPNWSRLFDFGTGTATNMFLTPRAGGATLRFAIRLNNGAEQQISYGTDLPLNQWRHVAVVLSGNTGRLYLSGIQVAQNTNLVLNPINLGATASVWLGRSQYTADPYLNGTLDDVRMSCRAYSDDEIAALAAM
jgi:galactose oxidase